MLIVVVDYGIGNVQSIINALLQFNDVEVILSDKEDVIIGADGLILPGVGAFKKAMEGLNERNLPSILGKYIAAYPDATANTVNAKTILTINRPRVSL